MTDKTRLRTLLIDMLTEAGINFVVNEGNKVYPGTISLSFKDSDGERILHRLDLQGIPSFRDGFYYT